MRHPDVLVEATSEQTSALAPKLRADNISAETGVAARAANDKAAQRKEVG